MTKSAALISAFDLASSAASLYGQNVSSQGTMTVGIDPGATGGIAILVGDKLLGVIDMPSEIVKVGRTPRHRVYVDGLVDFVSQLRRSGGGFRVVIEDVNGGARDGGGAAFVFGRSVGVIEGILAVFRIKPERAHPTVWKRRAGLSGAVKGASVAKAEALFPEHAALFRGPRGGGIDGRAEAALIAFYGRAA